jgi:hypothetical protein
MAVHPPVLPATEAVQLKKFENDQAATDWLISAINQGLAAKKVTNAANYSKSKLETYLGKIVNNIGEYSALGGLMTAYGGVFNAPADREANINGPLMKPAVQQAAVAAIRTAEVAAHFGVKKRTVTADQQDHIFLGEVDNPDNPTTVTGYHWEGDGNSVAVGVGSAQNTEDKFGVYQKGVAARARATVKKAGGSATASTFFPAAWSKAEILEAIEYAQKNADLLEAQTPAKAVPLKILSNESSFFPAAPGDQ